MTQLNNRESLIVNALLTEYQGLRAQIIEQVKSIYVIFGALATIFTGALGAGAALWQTPLFSAALFNVVVPFVLLIAATAVLFAVRDMMTIGTYLGSHTEATLQAVFGQDLSRLLSEAGNQISPSHGTPVLYYERWLRRTTSGHVLLRGNLMSFMIVFLVLFIVPTILGEVRLHSAAPTGVGIPYPMVEILTWCPLFIVLVSVVTLYAFYRGVTRL
jgi:hypothetical protein